MFALGLIVSLCFLPGWTGASVPTQWAVLSMVLPFLMVREGPWTFFHTLAIVFLIYAANLLRFSPVLPDAVYGLWVATLWVGILWLGTIIESLDEIIAGLGVGAVFSSAVAVASTIGPVPFPSYGPSPPGIYYNSVAQGEILALIMVALLIEQRIWFALLCAPGLILSDSRGAWAMFAIGFIAIFTRRWWLYALFIIPVGFAFTHFASDEQRLRIWSIAWDGLTFRGWGPGTFNDILYTNWLSQVVHPEFVHNDALQLFFEFGVAALVPISIFTFTGTRVSHPYWPIIVAFIAAGCYSFPLYLPITAFLGLLAAGNSLRHWALDGSVSDDSGSDILSRLAPRRYADGKARSEAIPMVTRTET